MAKKSEWILKNRIPTNSSRVGLTSSNPPWFLIKGDTMKKKWRKQDEIQYTLFCEYCMEPLDPRIANRDHIIPKSRGGKNTPDNIAIVHSYENLEKGALTYSEWRLWQLLERVRHGGKAPEDFAVLEELSRFLIKINFAQYKKTNSR